MFSQRLQAVSKSMTRKKNQEQLALPEIEPAFSLEIQALPEAASTSQAVPAPTQRTRSKRPPSNKEKATANHRPARKHRKNLLEVDADAGDAEGQAITEVTPARSYHRPTAPGPGQIQLRAEGRLLHIHLLSEPVVEWRSTERLCAGYTADGHLADLQIPDLARHLPANPLGDPALRARIDALQDELLFLKTGLALVLAGVIWLLLR